MTDQDSTPETNGEQAIYSPKDWMLDGFLQIFKGKDSEISLTFQSKGATVSGTLISREQYLERLAVAFDNAGSPEMMQVAEMWQEDMLARDARDAERQANGGGIASFHFLHMRDVVIYTGSVAVEMPLWRGTTEDITGWSIGKVSS